MYGVALNKYGDKCRQWKPCLILSEKKVKQGQRDLVQWNCSTSLELGTIWTHVYFDIHRERYRNNYRLFNYIWVCNIHIFAVSIFSEGLESVTSQYLSAYQCPDLDVSMSFFNKSNQCSLGKWRILGFGQANTRWIWPFVVPNWQKRRNLGRISKGHRRWSERILNG